MQTLLLWILAVALAPSQDEAKGVTPPAAEFSPLRQPVLGYAVEWNERSNRYRLVTVEPREVLVVGTLAECEERLAAELEERHGTGRPNVALPTFGGVQLWADVFWYADWRIQENVFTGHYRLLDPDDTRVAWGTREACRARFEAERAERSLQLRSPHLVVLLHGLGRTRKAFDGLGRALEGGGYEVASVGYPSTRRSIAEHALGLNALLDALDDTQRVSFVTHSLGGIVVRAALADESPGWRRRLTLGRVVMLAPPNQGSSLARDLAEFSPFRFVMGPSAEELAGELRDLPPPPCEFGVVAAVREEEDGWNPFLDGDDDGIVSLEETRLAGAKDTLRVQGVHTFVMQEPEVIEATKHFLREGRFRPENAGS